MNNLRVPIFEDKVVDFIVELAKVDERSVTPQELLAAGQDADERGDAGRLEAARLTAGSSPRRYRARRSREDEEWPITSNST